MQSNKKEILLNQLQKYLILLFSIVLLISLFLFKNIFFQPLLILKSFGERSVDPEIALLNGKPTFLEFYAEWCEVCKKMAPGISELENAFGSKINFVFLNVDNPKWEKYIREFNVNGIPQINLFNFEGELQSTYVGLQEEILIKNNLKDLSKQINNMNNYVSPEISQIREKNYNISPRTHG